MKKLFIPILIVLILASFVTAKFNYSETGNLDNYFQLGLGFFNEQLTDVDTFTKSISDPRQTPLISDLDNDGINEIIILDGATFRLYQNKELNIIDAFTLDSNERYSNFLTFDIDGDNFTEIIMVMEQSHRIEILEYNGTAFFNQSSINHSSLTVDDGEVAIKCGAIEECIMVYIERDSSFGGSLENNIYAIMFNSTNIGTETLIDTTPNTPPHTYCFPKVRTMAYADYDNDGDDEYIVSYMQFHTEGDEEVEISYLFINETLGVFEEQQISETEPGNVINEGSLNCNALDLGKHITDPLVFDIDGSSSNGLETVVGFMFDDDEFVMHSYSSNGVFLDDYPEIFESRGRLISNVLLTNAFPDTTDVDFCVMGYSDIEQEIRLLCASEQTGFIPETQEFNLDIDELYNVTDSYETSHILTHSTQHTTRTTEGNNLDEVVNSYGVLEIDWSFANELLLIYENPKPNAVVLSIDPEKVGREDLIVLTDTNLWYIDDGFSTSGAVISEYLINPCLDATWKQNTSVEVRITPTDVDGDEVMARAVLYANNDPVPLQDLGWSVLFNSGTTFTFNFIANETIGSGVLLLQANDTSNPTEIDEIELAFSVGVNGVVFDECTTEVTVEPIPDVIPPNCPDGVVDDDEECDDGNSVSGDGCSSSCTIEDGAIGDEISRTTNTPERFQPLMAGIIIIVIMWLTITVLAEKKIVDGMALVYVPIATGIVTWIILATPSVGMIPGWTVIIGILFASAFIGFKIYQNRSPGGAGGL